MGEWHLYMAGLFAFNRQKVVWDMRVEGFFAQSDEDAHREASRRATEIWLKEDGWSDHTVTFTQISRGVILQAERVTAPGYIPDETSKSTGIEGFEEPEMIM